MSLNPWINQPDDQCFRWHNYREAMKRLRELEAENARLLAHLAKAVAEAKPS